MLTPTRDPSPVELHDWNERLSTLIEELEGARGTPDRLAYLCQRIRVSLGTAHFFLLQALAAGDESP